MLIRETCSGKTRYEGKRAANAVLNAARYSKSRRRRGKSDKLRAYHCDRCNGWHVTHKEDIFA